MGYEELLKRAMLKVPKKSEDGVRFKVPKTQAMLAGARTIIQNFGEMARSLRREPGHLLKFLLKELATKGEIKGGRLTVLGKFPSEMIDTKIDLYIKNYVLCPECGKPDTRLKKEKVFTFLVCEACGARHSLGG